jgi:hypothetical protein
MNTRANQIKSLAVVVAAWNGSGRGTMEAMAYVDPCWRGLSGSRKNVLVNNFFRQVGTSLADSELNSMLLRAGGRRDDSEPGHGLVLRPQHVQAATAASSIRFTSPCDVN